ncbi:hypothetical protein TRL7639_04400 [Falsiruegeria litorea R37]|uniref:Antitoxin Xre/MbcA/ParS-like toxin-binding domain-containing protein n=1 Tax=Falsiruegeria litorea R37 TaxID=1200284 RepID=A0A1Y5TV08_9RHOB|nr:MbcA/ParS/Xre antitoxin family protein [Falsiruegeria litorea]SLN73300.1 hypothetical protein TRL7639_04400 [Falsiruegeria litorea R37]
MELAELIEDKVFAPAKMAAKLRTTQSEIAATIGLSRDAFSRKDRLKSVRTQTRLREMLEILNRVEKFTGSALTAYAWMRSEPIVGFGGQTAEQLIREGRADQVRRYLDHVAAGGYA